MCCAAPQKASACVPAVALHQHEPRGLTPLPPATRPSRSVSIRVRPLNRQEGQEYYAWRVEGNGSLCQLDPATREPDRTRDTKYVLDHVFGPEWTTRQIYESTTQPLIHKMVNGFNSTVFAYGQTSSGKTFTMRGTDDSPGLIPLAVAEAFHLIESNLKREYLIRVSYMEVGMPSCMRAREEGGVYGGRGEGG